MTEVFTLWDTAPGKVEQVPTLTYYKAKSKTTDASALIFPGGAYNHYAPHEGKGYAEYLNSLGMDAFVLEYRIDPAKFPLALLDARRALRFIKYNAENFGLNKNKVLVMGSSAGGNLASLLCACNMSFDDIEQTKDEIDDENLELAGQILCYPYVCMNDDEHKIDWLHDVMFGEGNRPYDLAELDPITHINEKTPPAFFTHNADDTCVNVNNSYKYASALGKAGIAVEMHIFPFGNHGLALADSDERKNDHVAQWAGLLKNWLKLYNFIQ